MSSPASTSRRRSAQEESDEHDVTPTNVDHTRSRQASYEAIIEEGEVLSKLQRFFWALRDINHAPVKKDNELVSANFPDTNVIVPSPAFLDPTSVPAGFVNGSQSPTDEKSMKSFLQSIAQRNEWAQYRVADFLSEEGHFFPYMYLSNNLQTINGVAKHKLRIWIQGGAHGNEPAGDQCVMALLGMMDLDQTWASSLLAVMDIILLPRYNPDGTATFSRNLTSNFDSNRDHIRLVSHQTRHIKRMFNGFAPHVAVDMHEYLASPVYGGCYQHASDALFSAAKNLNIHPDIRRMSEDVFAARISTDLKAKRFRSDSYVTGQQSRIQGSQILFQEAGSDGKLGRNAMGLTQCIAFLCETRGIGLADQHFKRRTAAGLTMLQSILQTALENAVQIHTVIKNAMDTFDLGGHLITVTDDRETLERNFAMIDSRSGCMVEVPVRIASTTPVIANLTRQMPKAYLIPYQLTEVTELLMISGLFLQRLDHKYVGMVSAYRISEVSFETTYYEGVVPVKVVTEPFEKSIELSIGAYIVSTRQKNAALAFIALEPENVDSYVSCNIIPVQTGDEYPIYRIV